MLSAILTAQVGVSAAVQKNDTIEIDLPSNKLNEQVNKLCFLRVTTQLSRSIWHLDFQDRSQC